MRISKKIKNDFLCRKKNKIGWAELFVQHFPILNKVRTTVLLLLFFSYFLQFFIRIYNIFFINHSTWKKLNSVMM